MNIKHGCTCVRFYPYLRLKGLVALVAAACLEGVTAYALRGANCRRSDDNLLSKCSGEASLWKGMPRQDESLGQHALE